MNVSPQRHGSLSVKKTKKDSQRQYRFKESDGFSELRHALQIIGPICGMTPHGRVTRHQLLIKAAEQLRHLAKENQELLQCMSGQDSTRCPGFTGTSHIDNYIDELSSSPEMALDFADQPCPASGTWAVPSQERLYPASDTESNGAFRILIPPHPVDQYW
ncbi:hypothetical protein F5I97DRAFT_1380337 [Phlebopus sp. FC_14]|nr:hypothetical protein F5I97DRAFT_1380337 [Phlebopus sp. FC_14]